MTDSPVLIIGSGPAGVSAAWPLLEAGLRVHMIDPGAARSDETALDDRDFEAWRRSDSQWQIFLGENAKLLENASPKLRAPEFAHVFEGFRQRLRIQAAGFAAHGSLAPGGLSGAWGSGVGAFTDEELAEYPITREDLAPSYDAVARRIGISGSRDDELSAWFGADYPLQPPNPLTPPFDSIYGRHLARAAGRGKQGRDDFRLGRPQQAVLTRQLGKRDPCDRRAMCIYGCKPRAIYNASYDLESLQLHPHFTYSTGWFANRVVRYEDRLGVEATNTQTGSTQLFTGSRVVLAAGTIASTKLALEFVGAFDVNVPLLTTPVLAFALLPRDLAAHRRPNGYALGLLAFALRLCAIPGEPEVFGGILPTTGLLPTELYRATTASGSLEQAARGLALAADAYRHMFFPGAICAKPTAVASWRRSCYRWSLQRRPRRCATSMPSSLAARVWIFGGGATSGRAPGCLVRAKKCTMAVRCQCALGPGLMRPMTKDARAAPTVCISSTAAY